MQLQSRDGVRCDCCGGSQRNDFTYYSLDFHQVDVQDRRFPAGWIDNPNDQVIFSLDACQACMTIIENAVKVNFKPMRDGIGCDLCTAVMKGENFTFYCCRVTRAAVSLTRGQYRCGMCGQPATPPPDGGQPSPCSRCGRQKLVKSAEVNTDDKYLQIMVCPTDYGKLTDNAVRLRSAAAAPQQGGK
jgi:hypothetical protein